MLRAKIKFVEITESSNLDPASDIPDDFRDFGCTLGLKIGPSNAEGDEVFYISVCSPKWLMRQCEEDGFVWGRHHLIVQEYTLRSITAVVTRFVENCSGESWPEAAAKLSRFAAWEFEDYVA